MKSVMILNAIGQIDDEMIESAVIQPARKRSDNRIIIFRIAVAVAASLVLIIGSLFAITKLQFSGSHKGTEDPMLGIFEPLETEPTQGGGPTQEIDPTQATEPTQGTDPTQSTEPTDVPVDPRPNYVMSCTISPENTIEDGYIPITISFGWIWEQPDPFLCSEARLEAGNYKDQTITIDKISHEDFAKQDYFADPIYDKGWWIIDAVFNHTETINLPLTLFSEDSGRIWIAITECTSNGERGEGAHVVLGYTRTEESIILTIVQSGI